MHKYIFSLKSKLFLISNSLLLLLIIFLSIIYVKHINLFNKNNIIIFGNEYIDKDKILNEIQLNQNKSIFEYDLDIIQDNIENIEFIKSAKISRVLPSTIVIEIIENEPNILVVFDEVKYFFDKHKTPLHANKKSINFFPVPIMSFHNEPFAGLENSKLVRALEFVGETNQIHTEFYESLSEIIYFNDNLTLVTDERTKIKLGNHNLNHKIKILKEFQKTIKNQNKLSDFSYIDLTIKDQIIVRENNFSRKKLWMMIKK